MLQSMVNRLLLPVSRYHAYEGDVTGWTGYYRFMRRCTAFRGNDGTMLYRW